MNSKMNVFRICSFATLALAISACEQNPFPTKEGNLLPVENKPDPVLPPFSVEVAPVLMCVEGTECSTLVIGRVPNQGKPIFEFEGLPAGATFAVSEGLLKFTPGYNTVDLSEDATQTSKTFLTTIVLRSDQGSVAAYRKQILIHVKNVMRPLTFRLENNDPQVLEGQTFSQSLSVESEDFPNGPFYLNIPNQPQGFSFVPDANSPKKFTINYTPSPSFVTPRDAFENGRYLKRFAMEVLISTPYGSASSQAMNWTVLDQRLPPNVSAPGVIRQAGSSINFTIRAEDPNGERAPTVVVNTNVPFGTMTAEKLEDAPGVPGVTLPSSLFNVRWDGIPANQVGKNHTVNTLVCGPSTLDANSICVNAQTRVEIAKRNLPLTELSRGFWESPEIKFVRAGLAQSFPLRVVNGTPFDEGTLSYEVLPSSMKKYIKLRGQQLTILSNEVGVHQFSLKLRSQDGAVSTESFVFEVLPQSWNERAVILDESVDRFQDFALNGDLVSLQSPMVFRALKLRKSTEFSLAARQHAEARQVQKFIELRSAR
jgi:hypothetical protein